MRCISCNKDCTNSDYIVETNKFETYCSNCKQSIKYTEQDLSGIKDDTYLGLVRELHSEGVLK